jgi:glycosyltransferase involved in cell wall biosynthesis
MILIDALYINSFGGRSILELLVKRILGREVKYHFIFDSRLKFNLIQKIKSSDYTFVEASHKKRKEFYLRRINNFSCILCLSNVPPPIQTSVKTYIYFHNILLLKPLHWPIHIKNRVINLLKFFYIKCYNLESYNWIVQTSHTRKLLLESIKIKNDRIHTYPILSKKNILINQINKSKNFVYISSSVSHKNHERLLKAFILAANKTIKQIKLHLTIDEGKLSKKIYPNNLKIECHGTLSEDGVNELYNSCEFLIYPSLVESFGLPLIEATNHGCKVIASDLPYVHEIIRPSLTFDPYLVESISDSILKALEIDNLPETKVLVENKLDSFIDFLISQDVQR